MTREQFKKWFSNFFGTNDGNKVMWINNREALMNMKLNDLVCNPTSYSQQYYAELQPFPRPTVSLGPCTTTATTLGPDPQYYDTVNFDWVQANPSLNGYSGWMPVTKQQGNNPMRNEISTTSAALTVIGSASDESKQRDYLLEDLDRLIKYNWNDPKLPELRKLFNIDAPTIPRSSQELLDAFKNGKFTVDQKKVDANAKYFESTDIDSDEDDDDYSGYSGERFYGITFTDLPVADRKGYHAAVEAYEKAKKDTKRKIIVASPAEGLDALIALENWKPETAAS